jgi:DNA-binding transcriptional LysR family regulator
MDLALLRTFLAVYRAGSLTGAATRLQVSQPTVTAQLQAIESRLGRQLFERRSRGVVPTAAADELAARVAVHLDALEVISELALPGQDLLATPLHLGGPAELTSARVLPALAGLVGRGLKLRITHGLADDLQDGLVAARFDVVISTVRPRGRQIAAVPLADEQFVLVAAPVWARRVTPEALAADPVRALRAVPLIAYASALPLIRRYWRAVFGAHAAGTVAVVVPNLWGVLSAATSGIGVTVLPRYLCERELREGSLIALLTPEEPPVNTLYFATRVGTGDLPLISAVRNRLVEDARNW